MEFKFSCKSFEIAFSGDPGYVEQQLEKYEPYVLNALQKVEQESRKDEPAPAPRPAAPTPPPPRDRDAQPPRPPYPQHNDRPQAPDQTRRYDRPRGFEPRREDPRRDDSRRDEQPPRRDDDRGRYRPDPPPPQQQPRREYSDQRPEQKKNEPAPQPVPVEVAEEITRARVEGLTPDLICDALADTPTPCPQDAPELAPGLPASATETERSLPTPAAEFPVRRRAPRVNEKDLAALVNEKKPRTHHDRVMVFGFYMENDGNGSDFTVPEIKRCYEAVNLDPGSSIEQVINHATRSGFVVRSEKGKTARYKLSNKGKRYVTDGLRLA